MVTTNAHRSTTPGTKNEAQISRMITFACRGTPGSGLVATATMLGTVVSAQPRIPSSFTRLQSFSSGLRLSAGSSANRLDHHLIDVLVPYGFQDIIVP